MFLGLSPRDTVVAWRGVGRRAVATSRVVVGVLAIVAVPPGVMLALGYAATVVINHHHLSTPGESPWGKPYGTGTATEKAVKRRRVEYRVVENHLVKFEEGQPPYMYSVPSEIEQR